MADVRALFLSTADAVLDLLDDDAVEAAWSEPSCLEGMTVGGLAAHTARAVTTVARYLDQPAPPPSAALEDAAGYVLAVVPDPAPTSDVNVAVLGRAETGAGAGLSAVIADARAVLADLDGRLESASADAAIAVLDGVALLLDDYLATRLVELVVHADDVLASVDLGRQLEDVVPDAAGASAVATLAELARRRSSTARMIRSLARSERADERPPTAL